MDFERPHGVPYPKNRKELQTLDSHVYGQLTASLSTEATRTVADDSAVADRQVHQVHEVHQAKTARKVNGVSAAICV